MTRKRTRHPRELLTISDTKVWGTIYQEAHTRGGGEAKADIRAYNPSVGEPVVDKQGRHWVIAAVLVPDDRFDPGITVQLESPREP